MTTDSMQDKHLRLRPRLTSGNTSGLRRSYTKPQGGNGIELTRLQNFVDGGYDIFDVLEHHAANTQMKIKAPLPKVAPETDYDIAETNLFKSLLSRLKEQMKEMMIH